MIAKVDSNFFKKRPSAAVRRIATRAFFEGRPITTKGRWFNAFVFAHFGLEKRLPQLRKVEKPIFVVGTGRSGTTLLSTLLSLHPQLGVLYEAKAMWHAIYAGEDVSGNYTQGPARYRLEAADATPEVITAAHKLFGAYSALTFAPRIADKDPELIFRVPFLLKIFPDARIILLVRNGYDTVNSIANWSGREGVVVNGQVHDWWGVDKKKWWLMVDELVVGNPLFAGYEDQVRQFTRHEDMAAIEWIVTMQEGVRQLARFPNALRLMRYEDLLNSPRETLNALQDYAEIERDEKMLAYAEQRLEPAPEYRRPAVAPFLVPLLEQVMADLYQPA